MRASNGAQCGPTQRARRPSAAFGHEGSCRLVRGLSWPACDAALTCLPGRKWGKACNEVRFEARWKLGRLLAKVERDKGGRPLKNSSRAGKSFFAAYLKEIGLDKNRANECERIGNPFWRAAGKKRGGRRGQGRGTCRQRVLRRGYEMSTNPSTGPRRRRARGRSSPVAAIATAMRRRSTRRGGATGGRRYARPPTGVFSGKALERCPSPACACVTRAGRRPLLCRPNPAPPR